MLGVASAPQARAGSFSIAPIRAYLSGAQRTGVFTLTNQDDAPVVVEVGVVAWSQEAGEDRLTDTHDPLVTPPVLKLAGHGDQIVRVALRRAPDAQRETAYRVILQEVPGAAPAGFSGLQVALRLSVPVFVAPSQGQAHADLTWEVHRTADGQIEVTVSNRGNGHAQIIDFEARLPGEAGAVRGMTAKYVLPGSRANWVLKPPGTAVPAGTVRIHGHDDQGEFSADVAYSGS